MHTRPRSLSDARFFSIQELLRSVEPTDESGSELADRAQAAVSIVLREAPRLDVLLIRRAEAEGDPWSGHMALPGGRRDATDRDLLHTAIRETREETAVPLSDMGLPLGHLAPVTPATRRLPPIVIFPYVFGVPAGTAARAASREVDEVLWTPLETLMRPDVIDTVEIPTGDTVRVFPCFRLGERIVWGLTFRILSGFLDLLKTSAPRSGW